MSHFDSGSIEELKNLIDLDDGIISTYSATDLVENAHAVEDNYRQYTGTHISMGDTEEFEASLYESLTESDRPTKGFLYAPYGYGKTSTAVNIWANLAEQDIIAVPPFTFTSFSDLIEATYGWIRFVFEDTAPEYIDELEEIHESYLQQEAEEFAEEAGDEYDKLNNDQLQELVSQWVDQKGLNLRIDPVTLANFFNDCTELVLDAGFNGLVVLPDELQQYFKGASSRQEAETDLRDFVFDLQSGATVSERFAFIVAMPDTTKSNLDSQAGDVIQRLQNNNVTINLQTVYGQEFPAQLWDRYAAEFGFEDGKYDIITEDALKAIGEVCARQDLSAGPRTVIDLFRIALTDYLNDGQTFGVVDLADAFYGGRVRYDQDATIESAIRDGLNNSNVTKESDRTVIKICAVHPQEGLPAEVARSIGVEAAYEDLQKKLQGPVLTWRTDGYTLSGLDDNDDPFVQQLLRQFWDQYDTDDVNAEYAVDAFANEVLEGEIFESQRGKLTGWTTEGFDPLQPRVCKTVATGTFDGRYPERRLQLRVATHEDRDALEEEEAPSLRTGPGPKTEDPDPDVAFDFVLDYSASATPQIRERDEGHYLFILDAAKALNQLPQGMKNFQKSMNPNQVTPFLMLSLISFVNSADFEADASQERDIDAIEDRLRSESIKNLFDPNLTENAPFDIRRAGQRAVEEVFTHAMEDLFAQYDTLMMGTQYRSLLDDYKLFLDSLSTVSMRRGSVPVEESKDDIIDRFNLRGASAFEDRANKQYSDLIELESWSGKDAVIRAKLHPFEETVLSSLEKEETLSKARFEEIAYNRGYRGEEPAEFIELLTKRGLVKVEGDELMLASTDISLEKVHDQIRRCQETISKIETLDANRVPDDVRDRVTSMADALENLSEHDTEQLETLDVRSREVESRLDAIASDLYTHYKKEARNCIHRLEDLQRGLMPTVVKNSFTGAVAFIGNLNDIRVDIKSDFQGLRTEIEETKDTLENRISKDPANPIEAAEDLADAVASAEADLENLHDTKTELNEYAEALNKWDSVATKAANVKRNLNEAANAFDGELEELDQIKYIFNQIAEQLTDKPRVAITNFETYRESIESVEDAFESRVRKRRELFDNKKEQLKEILQQATENTATGLRRADFSIDRPEQKQKDLIDQFQEEYRSQVLDKAESQLDEARRDVVYAEVIGVGEIEGTAPADVQADIDVVESKIANLKTILTRFAYDDIGPLDEEGPASDLAEDGLAVYTRADKIRSEAGEFLKERDPEDSELQEFLADIEDKRQVGFKEIIMDYHTDSGDEAPDPEELLSQINELFILNQIDIQITSRQRR